MRRFRVYGLRFMVFGEERSYGLRVWVLKDEVVNNFAVIPTKGGICLIAAVCARFIWRRERR